MYNNNTNSFEGFVETIQTNNTEIVFNKKLFEQNPSLTETFFAINNKGEKIKIRTIGDSPGGLTKVTLDKTFNQTPKKDNKIKLIKEEDYKKQEKIIRDQTKKDLEDSYQNVDAKYKRHPLNYSMRNVWLWLIFATSLFTHSIVVFSGFAYKRTAASSPAIDLDLL